MQRKIGLSVFHIVSANYCSSKISGAIHINRSISLEKREKQGKEIIMRYWNIYAKPLSAALLAMASLLTGCGSETPSSSNLLAVSPHAVGTQSTETPSSGICKGIDFGSFNYDVTGPEEIAVDPQWKENNTVGIWFFASEGKGSREINGKTYRTTELRVHRQAFGGGCQAFLKARNILISRPDLIPLVKTAKAYRTTISRGSSNISSHAWGLAVDINGSDFPYGTVDNNPNSANAILWREVFEKSGFRWGNHFPRLRDPKPADPMHFEIHVSKR
jgi:hypothetical protein